jgi:hypothetical protein
MSLMPLHLAAAETPRAAQQNKNTFEPLLSTRAWQSIRKILTASCRRSPFGDPKIIVAPLGILEWKAYRDECYTEPTNLIS